jgi:hypothetical protein
MNNTIKDAIGREIKVGDFVVPLKNSSFTIVGNKPKVVCRLGSSNRVMLDASSYGVAENLLVVNEQFEHQFGVQWCKELRSTYESEFIHEQVKKGKDTKTRYVVYYDIDKKAFFIYKFSGPTSGDLINKEANKCLPFVSKKSYWDYQAFFVFKTRHNFKDNHYACCHINTSYIDDKYHLSTTQLRELGLQYHNTEESVPVKITDLEAIEKIKQAKIKKPYYNCIEEKTLGETISE